MTLDWNETQADNGSVISFAECTLTEDGHVYGALAQAIEKAVELLNDNVKDDSRYFLFEWDAVEAVLTIVVTDDDKKSDSPKVVKLALSGLAKPLETLKDDAVSEWAATAAECSDNIKYFIRDYLTTSSGFHQYSLIAIFHNESRDNTELL